MDHDELLRERGRDYGAAWLESSRWLVEHSDELARAGNVAFLLTMIQAKLTRALYSPHKRDHFDDIIGYAKLALEALNLSAQGPSVAVRSREADARERAMRGDLDPDIAVRRERERRENIIRIDGVDPGTCVAIPPDILERMGELKRMYPNWTAQELLNAARMVNRDPFGPSH